MSATMGSRAQGWAGASGWARCGVSRYRRTSSPQSTAAAASCLMAFAPRLAHPSPQHPTPELSTCPSKDSTCPIVLWFGTPAARAHHCSACTAHSTHTQPFPLGTLHKLRTHTQRRWGHHTGYAHTPIAPGDITHVTHTVIAPGDITQVPHTHPLLLRAPVTLCTCTPCPWGHHTPYAYAHVHTNTITHTHTQTHMHTCTHAHRCTQTQKQTHTHTSAGSWEAIGQRHCPSRQLCQLRLRQLHLLLCSYLQRAWGLAAGQHLRVSVVYCQCLEA